jgi:hypothetical protein
VQPTKEKKKGKTAHKQVATGGEGKLEVDQRSGAYYKVRKMASPFRHWRLKLTFFQDNK